MYRIALATAFLATVLPTSALADHCAKEYRKYEATRDKLDAQHDEAEAAEDDEASCAILKKIISLEEKAAKSFEESCFHDGNGAAWAELGVVSLAATEMLKDMTCLGE